MDFHIIRPALRERYHRFDNRFGWHGSSIRNKSTLPADTAESAIVGRLFARYHAFRAGQQTFIARMRPNPVADIVRTQIVVKIIGVKRWRVLNAGFIKMKWAGYRQSIKEVIH